MAEEETHNDNLPEGVLWKGSPAQLTNIWRYLLALVLIIVFIAGGIALSGNGMWTVWVGLVLAAIAAGYALVHYLQTRFYEYELTNERLRIRSGVLNRQTDELELYRVHDIVLNEPFWYRLFGLGNIILHTSDETNPELTIRAVPGAQNLRDQIRDNVEKVRQQKRVRTIEGFGE
jgi:uncharacterized membrane protein YdbT with pleckstrin-like domain